MNCKDYYISLYPGSRPNGAKQFGSAKEEQHFKEVVNRLSYIKDSKVLEKLGVIRAKLTIEEYDFLIKDPSIRSINEVVSHKPAVTQIDAGWALSCICDRQAENKFTYFSEGEGVDIYIVDDGISPTISDEFAGGLSRIYDRDPTLLGCSHGSPVSLLAAGRHHGAARKARVFDVKCGDENGQIVSLEGLDAVLTHHVDNIAVCNMSFGSSIFSQELTDAVAALQAEGIICIAASGNELTDAVHYPSDDCISISACTEALEGASFTNYGSNVDLFAPGVFCSSLDLHGNFLAFSGTSAACPITAGVAACLMSEKFKLYNNTSMLNKLIDLARVDGVTHSFGTNTTTLLLQASRSAIWEGLVSTSDTAFSEKLASLDFRKNYKFEFSTIDTDGTELVIIDSTFKTVRYATAGVVISQGNAFTNNITSVNLLAYMITPGDTPVVGIGSTTASAASGTTAVGNPAGSGDYSIVSATVDPTLSLPGGALAPVIGVASSIPPEELITLQLSLSGSTGNSSFSTKNPTGYALKDIINLQGIDWTVGKIKPIYNRTREYSVESIARPYVSKEFISINYSYNNDGSFVSVHTILQEVAATTGVIINIAVSDIKVKEFIQAGLFTSVIDNLASLLEATVVQQNGVYYIISGRDSIGDFTITDGITSYSRTLTTSAIDNALSLVTSLKDALVDLAALQEELKDLNDELELLELIDDEEEEAGKDPSTTIIDIQFLGNVLIKFGQVNNTQWQSIDNSFAIAGNGKWTYWIPEANKSINPTEPAARYYRVEEVRDLAGELTGEQRGMYVLGSTRIQVEIQEPSNFGGIYYVRGRSFNFFGGISRDFWTSPSSFTKTELNPTTHQFEARTFLEFSPKAPPEAIVSNANDEGQYYLLDVEVGYLPALVSAWKFSGTVNFEFWPVKSGLEYVGRIDRDGNFFDPSGKQITTVDELSEIPGDPTNELCVLNDEGELCGVGAYNWTFLSLTGTPAGVYNPTTHNLYSNTLSSGALLGWVGGELPADHVWPGLNDTEELPDTVNIYFSSDMPGGHGIDFSGYDPEHPELWTPVENPEDEEQITAIEDLKIEILEKENELLTAEVNINNLKEELGSYGASSLIPLVTAWADATIALQDEIERQQKLNIKNQTLIGNKQTIVASTSTAVYNELSSLNLSSLEITCSFIYMNSLPMIQSELILDTSDFTEDKLIITDVSLQLGSASVTVNAIRRISGE